MFVLQVVDTKATVLEVPDEGTKVLVHPVLPPIEAEVHAGLHVPGAVPIWVSVAQPSEEPAESVLSAAPLETLAAESTQLYVIDGNDPRPTGVIVKVLQVAVVVCVQVDDTAVVPEPSVTEPVEPAAIVAALR